MAIPEMRELLEAGAHFGHQTHRWNPKMRQFIFMKRSGIHIIDLAKTLDRMQKAKKTIEDTVRRGEKVLFVCTKKQGKNIVREEAQRCGQLYMTERWLGGTLTNLATVKKSVGRLLDIERMAQDGTFELLSKKEVLTHEKHRVKLAKVLDGIREMKKMPGLLFIVDSHREKIAVSEAGKLSIPIVGVLDTNADPAPIDFPIPGNDDAIRSIRLFSAFVADCVLEASAARLEGSDAVVPAAAGAEGGSPEPVAVAAETTVKASAEPTSEETPKE
ncbi:30S ribosomal protein S2 [bacterium]|nr:30S ribosomal protein S2 [bacterium]